MPIPYRDQEDIDELGTAAFLLLESDALRGGYRAALFQITARGEPVEFTYNRVEIPNTFLWRPADLRRAAARKLTTSLLALSPRVPRLLFCRADQAPGELFSQDLALAIPVCRVATSLKDAASIPDEHDETVEQPEPLHLFWLPAPPQEGSPERALLTRLTLHGLLLEPFERASTGLSELYGEGTP